MSVQKISRLIVLPVIALMCTTLPVHAQYFYDTPRQPSVEVDLSVLEDTHTPAPTTFSAPSVAVEQNPLPAPAPAASTVSPYERARVVTRIELEGANPYLGKTAASPFTPPAMIKPPAPVPEAPRTRPAALVKPRVDTDMPMIIDGASDGDITLE